MSKNQNNDINPIAFSAILLIAIIIYIIETYGIYILITLAIIVSIGIIYFIAKKLERKKEKERTIEKPEDFHSDYEISPDSQLLKIWKSGNMDLMTEVLPDEMINKAKLCRVVKNNKIHDNDQLIHRIVKDAFPHAVVTMQMVTNIHYYNQKLNYIINKSSTTVKKEMDTELRALIKAQEQKDEILN